MSVIKAGIYYTKRHEWANVEKDIVTIGITDYAQKALGDIVFVDLPQVGNIINKEESFGSIESVKSVSDLYAPVSGKVVEVNEEIKKTPELINNAPYEEGWLIKVEPFNNLDQELRELLEAKAYEAYLKEEGE